MFEGGRLEDKFFFHNLNCTAPYTVRQACTFSRHRRRPPRGLGGGRGEEIVSLGLFPPAPRRWGYGENAAGG
jgi:hypothetical protein